MSGDIIDAIDRALTDYGTSMDAMRWVTDVPEDEPEPGCVLCGGPCRVGLFSRVIVRRWGPEDDARAAAIIMAELRQRYLDETPLTRVGVGGGVERTSDPTDPRTRALALRQSRNVGPDGRTPAGRKRRT